MPYLSLFPEINFVWKATFAKKILFPGSIISQKVEFPGNNIVQDVTFPGKTHFPAI